MTVWTGSLQQTIQAANRGKDPRNLVSRGPRTGFVENNTAAYEATRSSDQTVSEQRNLREAYDVALQVLNIDGVGFKNPYGWSPGERNTGLDRVEDVGLATLAVRAGLPGGTRRGEEDRIWAAIDKRREQDPAFMPQWPTTREALKDKISKEVRGKHAKQQEILSRARGGSATLATFFGTAGALLTDPVNLVTLPVGAGSGTILKLALTESLIAMGIETAIQPTVQNYREEVGLDHGFQQGFENVLMAGAGAGLLTGVIATGLKGAKVISAARVINGMGGSRKDLIAAFDELVPNPTPEQMAARSDLEQLDFFDDMNPGPNTAKGRGEHMANMDDLDEILDSGGPRLDDRQGELPNIVEEVSASEIRIRDQAEAMEKSLLDENADLTKEVAVELTLKDDQTVGVKRQTLGEIKKEFEADEAFVKAIEECAA